MTTTRSLFTIEQFNRVFQKLAHEKAIEAVTSLESGDLLVKAYSKGRLSEVNTGIYHFKFYAKHLSYSYSPDGTYNHPDRIDIDIEEKYYSTSRDCTKISYFVYEKWDPDEEKAEAINKKRHKAAKKKINEFLEKLMKEAGLKPIPRFSLKKYKNYTKPEDGVSLDSVLLTP